MVKWVVELGQFDIYYQPSTIIKGQVLAKLTPAELDEGDQSGIELDFVCAWVFNCLS